MDPVIDSWQLRMFAVLARTKSFSGTARELGLTQSAVSHALRRLEADLGVGLLERQGRATALTPAGERLLAGAETMLRQMGRMRAEVEAIGRGRGRPLRVGCPGDLAERLMPAAIGAFRGRFPGQAVHVLPPAAGDPAAAIREGGVDLVVAPEAGGRDRLRAERIFSDVPGFLVAAGHRWAAAGRADAGGISRESFLVAGGAGSDPAFAAHLRGLGVAPGGAEECGGSGTMVERVRLGHGVGIGPAWVAERAIRRGEVAAVRAPEWDRERHWAVHFSGDSPALPVVEAFAGCCRCAIPFGSDAAA